MATLLLAATAAAMAVDCPLAFWFERNTCPDLLKRALLAAELFGHGIGVLVIAVSIHQLDPGRRWALPRLLVMSLGAGLVADSIKLIIARTRPSAFGFDGGVAETFGRWLPLLDVDKVYQSFPSAHTATAVALAIALIRLYPRGRWLFISLALLVPCQRIAAGYHYLSDTVFGVGVGLFVAVGCLNNVRLAACFERLEGYLQALHGRPHRNGED